MSLDAVLSQIDNDLPDATQRLLDLLRIQSISTDPAFKDACDTAADWLVDDLQSLGVDAKKTPDPRPPDGGRPCRPRERQTASAVLWSL